MANSEEFLLKSCLKFPVNVQTLPAKGLALELKTDVRERVSLAAAHNLSAVHSFVAAFTLYPWKKRGVRVKGRIEAEIEQVCVISFEPLHNRICQQVDAYFVPKDSHLVNYPENTGVELFLDPEGADIPETFSGGSLDIGAVAEEFFELAIDPYPRKDGISLSDVWHLEAGTSDSAFTAPNRKKVKEKQGEQRESVLPFSVLQKLKKH